MAGTTASNRPEKQPCEIDVPRETLHTSEVPKDRQKLLAGLENALLDP